MDALQQISQETIELTKTLFQKTDQGLEKAITTSTGLYGYSLEQPAKRLYPVLSPLRNRISRQKAPIGAPLTNWKAITGINTTNVRAAVSFGTRNTATITYGRSDRSATFKTIGLEDTVQDESVWYGRGFEDVRALSSLSTLQSLMIEEEKLILGGLSDAMTLGTTPTPTVAKAATGGLNHAANFYVKVVALSLYGYLNSTLNDYADATGRIYDHGIYSATATVGSCSATDTVFARLAAPTGGAFAWAWFVATHASAEPASLKLYAITTIPSVRITDISKDIRGGTLSSNIGSDKTSPASQNFSTDTSGDANAFDGLFPQVLPPYATLTTLGTYPSGTLKKVTGSQSTQYVTSAIVYDMAPGDDFQGTGLTADNAGGIVEFDLVLKALWDHARIGPSLVLVNSQEAGNITRKIGGSTGLGFRIQASQGDKGIVGGIYVAAYLNKYSSSLTPGSPDQVPLMMHPFLPPGTILFLSENLPYPDNNVPRVLEIETQQEYADFEWARTQRQYEHGVYANQVLKHYFPAGCAVIRGLKDA